MASQSAHSLFAQTEHSEDGSTVQSTKVTIALIQKKGFRHLAISWLTAGKTNTGLIENFGKLTNQEDC